jgi:TRAP-type C4-dicarboxylate transport system substrate-binding protein
MLAPRGSIVHREFKRLDKEIQKATNNTWSVKVYPSGMAGDDTDVIRKMRVKQMDGGVITTTGLSHIVRQVAVLDAPGVVNNYKQLEAVQREMKDEWDKMFLKANTKLVAWWEAGRYRLFSKGPSRTLAEARKHRAWLWPDSQVMKELWRAMGVTGVPLALNDVFGALQTGMVDLVVNTPVALVALRWHLNLDHVSQREAGVLLLAWVMNKDVWNELPDDAKQKIEKWVAESAGKYKRDARKEDKQAFKTLLRRGYTATKLSPKNEKEFNAIEATVRKRLTGRVYPKSLLDRVMSVAKKAK